MHQIGKDLTCLTFEHRRRCSIGPGADILTVFGVLKIWNSLLTTHHSPLTTPKAELFVSNLVKPVLVQSVSVAASGVQIWFVNWDSIMIENFKYTQNEISLFLELRMNEYWHDLLQPSNFGRILTPQCSLTLLPLCLTISAREHSIVPRLSCPLVSSVTSPLSQS